MRSSGFDTKEWKLWHIWPTHVQKINKISRDSGNNQDARSGEQEN